MSNDFYCEEVLSGRTPVEVVLETDRVLAFHYTKPTWEVHIVVIPKKHIQVLTDVADVTLLSELLSVVQTIIRHRGFNCSNYKLITNGGEYQSTQHLHFHLVSGRPRDMSNSDQQGELQVR